MLRVIWALFGIFFVRGSTRLLSPMRIFLLKLFGAHIDTPALVMDGVRIWCPWNLRMARYSAIGTGVEIYNFAPVSIGEQTTVSQYSFICTASHNYRKVDMPLIYRPIMIEDQVWIAADCFVGPGVTIGQGAVVGARAVVTRNVAPWTVVAGNPAVAIKKRVLEK